LQRLSTFNASNNDRKIDSSEKFPLPWNNFVNDVKNIAEKILVVHKKNNKVVTKNSKGFCARGQLHKETIYGKRKSPELKNEGYHVRKKISEFEKIKELRKIADRAIRFY